MHIKAGQTLERKVSIAGALVSTVNTAVQAQHHTDGMFSHSFRGIGRNTDNLNTQLFSGG